MYPLCILFTNILVQLIDIKPSPNPSLIKFLYKACYIFYIFTLVTDKYVVMTFFC